MPPSAAMPRRSRHWSDSPTRPASNGLPPATRAAWPNLGAPLRRAECDTSGHRYALADRLTAISSTTKGVGGTQRFFVTQRRSDRARTAKSAACSAMPLSL